MSAKHGRERGQSKGCDIPVRVARGKMTTPILYQMQDILQIPYKTSLPAAFYQ
jgi:hypothetical protein